MLDPLVSAMVKTLIEYDFIHEPKAEVDVELEEDFEGTVITWCKLEEEPPDTVWAHFKMWGSRPNPMWMIGVVLGISASSRDVTMRFEFIEKPIHQPENCWYFMDTDIESIHEWHETITDVLDIWIENGKNIESENAEGMSEAETDHSD